MTLHLVALPHTQTTAQYLTCAYTQKIVKFCRMMEDHHQVILYSGDENDAPCAEHVPLFSELERWELFGDGFNTVTDNVTWNPDDEHWRRMNDRAVAALTERVEDGDLLLLTGGLAQQPIADWVNIISGRKVLAVEWAVGYEGVFSDYCAFESYAWMHHVYGQRGFGNGRFYDQVIPNFFDPDDFQLADKEDYLLYLGRMVERKGPHVAAQIARRVGLPLICAGPGATVTDGRVVCHDGTALHGDVEYIGEVNASARAPLLAEARALLAPTLYIEPFGGAAVEAMLSGTPVIAPDFGAYTETVTTYVGQRFRTLEQAAAAVDDVIRIDPDLIRHHALARYSFDAVRPRFTRWFDQLDGLWAEGWAA